MMKILVFEYISGGGFNRNELPAPLACEGLLMLKALLDGLCEIPDLDITVMVDKRLEHELGAAADIHLEIIGLQDDCLARFRRLVGLHDAVWPIAPEFDKILFTLCRTVEQFGKLLLAPAAEAVRLASDKYETFRCLSRGQIPTVATRLLDDCSLFPGECIVKPIDGVGCCDSYLIRGPDDFDRVAERLRGTGKYIVQPHVYGEKTSLSCLFKNGQAWILSVNLQQFDIVDNQYQLFAIEINLRFDSSRYRELVDKIANEIPGLWGYVGIDLIETPQQSLVLEINPRLTSSFAGLRAALGVNAVALVFQLLKGDPLIRPTANKTVTLQIKKARNGE
jgi:predicted ATP-grasp superfamily ATP-dependent carboligase